MKESLRDYYYHPEFTMADKSFMMIPTPQRFRAVFTTEET